MRSTITIDWDDRVLSAAQIVDADERVHDVLEQYRIFNHPGQRITISSTLHGRGIDPGIEPEEKDPITESIDDAYHIIGVAQGVLQEQDHEWASEAMVDAIQDHHTLESACRLIRELVDPREGEDFA